MANNFFPSASHTFDYHPALEGKAQLKEVDELGTAHRPKC